MPKILLLLLYGPSAIATPTLITSVKAPGKCMHLESGWKSKANGDNIHLWDTEPGSHPAQEWILKPTGVGGSVLITSVKAPGKCMHLESGWKSKATNGENIRVWDTEPGSFPAARMVTSRQSILTPAPVSFAPPPLARPALEKE